MKRFFLLLFIVLFLGNIFYILAAFVFLSKIEETSQDIDIPLLPIHIPDQKTHFLKENNREKNINNDLPTESTHKKESKTSEIYKYESETIWATVINSDIPKNISNDPFSHLQYYLNRINVWQAWEKVNGKNRVIVAVIDDGLNINHPDLTDNIWVETGSSYGTSKIKNFVGDEVPDNFPTGKHGTMVAGIIGATINNNIWIAGIAKYVDIMPLRVFDFKWNAKGQNIIDALYYAISHKANIINLSLWQSQFEYSEKFDEVIKFAYSKGIVVVIAAGNGDILSRNTNWVNTTINPLSPVCNNNGNNNYSIGVWSLTQLWLQAQWSNYGSCVSLFAPGENIFSTSIAVFNKEYWVDYDTDSGTSFSAPMISGIVALGFNQFGRVPPDIVRESLNESLRLNESGQYTVDASRYLEILNQKQIIIQEYQSSFHLQNKITEQILTQKNNLSRLSNTEYLATLGYIERNTSTGAYNLSGYLSRLEMAELAMKLSEIQIPKWYICRWIFADISAISPDSGSCPLVETALQRGIITQDGGNYFKPRENISLVEAVSMLLRASNIKIQQYSGGEFEPWQTNVIGTSFGLGLVENQFNFSISKKAVRRDIFSITRKIIELRK